MKEEKIIAIIQEKTGKVLVMQNQEGKWGLVEEKELKGLGLMFSESDVQPEDTLEYTVKPQEQALINVILVHLKTVEPKINVDSHKYLQYKWANAKDLTKDPDLRPDNYRILERFIQKHRSYKTSHGVWKWIAIGALTGLIVDWVLVITSPVYMNFLYDYRMMVVQMVATHLPLNVRGPTGIGPGFSFS